MYKKNILELNRYQTSQNRDLKKGIILDRNERVDYFDNKTFIKILKNISRYSLNTTPDINSLYNLIAKYHKVKKENIYITQGITECISQILFSTLSKKDEVILMYQTYPMYEVLCKLHNIKYKLWKFDKNFKLNIKDLKKIINKKTKAIFLVNPNLPIEYEFNKKIKEEIYKISKKKDILIIYDEAYYHFGAKSEINKINKHKNLIIMRTFSKAWGLSGIRLGYMVSQSKLTNYISKCRSLVETNSLSYQVASWALKNKNILNDHVKNVKSGTKFIKEKLSKIGVSYQGGNVTNAMLIKLPNKSDTVHLKNYLRKKNIYIRDNFYKPIDNYVRISLCSKEKLSKFFTMFMNWKKKYYKNF